MPESNANNQFIVCPVCDGNGSNKYGLGCQNCGGIGAGKFFQGRFFYWGGKLNRFIIEIDHLRKKTNHVINISAFMLGLCGFISLAWWIYISGQTEQAPFAFWREKSSFLLFFWISVIADMFVVYRISEDERRQHKIRPLKYEERSAAFALPDNWDELKRSSDVIKIDVSTGFEQTAVEAVEQAYTLADKLSHKQVTPVHLLLTSLKNVQVAAIFTRLNVDSAKLMAKTREQLEKIESSEKRTIFSGIIKEVLVEAYLEAYGLGRKKVSAKNFIIPIIDRNAIMREILYDLEVDRDKIFNVLLWFMVNEKLVENHRLYRSSATYKPGTNMDRAYTSVATPVLNQIGYDLTLAAKWSRLEYCVARNKETEKIFQHFESGKNGVILVGLPGVGKSTVVDGIAQLMVREDVPGIFKDKRLVELDAARLISGATPAAAEGKLMAIMDEIIRAGNIIVYIDNIENLIGITSGEEESLDLSEVLTGALERGNFFCLASATSENYIKYIENKSLGGALVKVEIGEPTGNQAIQIVESKIGRIEGKHKVYFSYNAIEEVIRLSGKYIHDKYQPQKSIEILELVAVRVARNKGKESLVTRDDIAAAIGEITNIPMARLTETESRGLLNLEEKIHEQMINQSRAVQMVAASLRRARTELREGKRPIANFLFLGPTGVGKTELAKTVANVYFGNEKCMIRLDMSEFQHQDSLSKMIGDSSGVLGYLTEAVRRKPFSLILLDELEKANQDILNIFLQVMDDGRLTDGQGRTIDFTNSIIIATSNIGAVYIQEQIFKGTPVEEIKKVLINEHINKVLRPELINRFDGVIVFEPLSLENVVSITGLMFKKIGKILESKGIGLRVDEAGKRILATEGFDPKFGARPLRRLLQEKVEDIIANKILGGELKRRDTVVVDDKGAVVVEKRKEL